MSDIEKVFKQEKAKSKKRNEEKCTAIIVAELKQADVINSEEIKTEQDLTETAE